MDHGVQAALAAWGLEPTAPVTAASSGTMNETFIVSTAARPVVLRRHRLPQRQQIEFEHAVIAHARRGHLPTPAAIPTPDGEYIIGHDGAFYSLFNFARGDQLPADQLTSAHAWSMGQVLARIHRGLADLPAAPSPPVQPHSVADTLAAIDTLVRRIEERSELDECDHWALHHLRSKADWLEANPAPDWHPVPADVVQMVHGDYLHHNLFFTDGAVVDIIDWDKTGPRWPVDEIVRVLDLSLHLQPELCAAFLTGYRTRRELALGDLDMAAANYNYGRVHGHWVFEELYLRDNERVRPFLEPGPFIPFLSRWNALRPTLPEEPTQSTPRQMGP